ncbi:serine/threonine protein kinase [Luteolibacter pohnpeiensis]|uniref:Serine/threonine protein kinase n=1 Tax=Luteolibacter pohnpeiensis TaxID=454153 RepID=A0A934S272_9BACT|nr:serine/threonine-protein kinase [Luteolibacter pohnpeiensis]MBK1880982.1 serine/threonine protein kinase [Luteolibacter pohnpeiensis]
MPELDSATVDKLADTAEMFLADWGEGFSFRRKPIGVGATAAVFEVSKKKAKYALKIYSERLYTGEKSTAQLHRTKLQEKLIGHDCKSLVTIQSIQLYKSSCICLMEYLPWDTLKKCLAKIPEDKIQILVDQLIDVIDYLKSVNLIHRDIKPENILISPDFCSLKVVDIGVVREISGAEDRIDGTDTGKLRPFLATAQYSPPEYLFRTFEPSEDLWNAVNIYQIGAIVHDMIVQKPLFDEEVHSGNRYKLALAVLRSKPVLGAAAKSRESRLAAIAELALIKDPVLRNDLVKISDFRTPKSERASEALAGILGKISINAKHQSKLNELIEEKERYCSQKIETIVAATIASIHSNFEHSLKCNRQKSKSTLHRQVFQIKLPARQIKESFFLEFDEIVDPTLDEINVILGREHGSTTITKIVGTMSSESDLLEPGIMTHAFEAICEQLKANIDYNGL